MDTSPEAQEEHIRLLRAMGIDGRAQLTLQLNRQARALLEEGVRLRHPNWPEDRIRRETARLLLGPTLFTAVYGTDASCER